jgi:hypothetical protein
MAARNPRWSELPVEVVVCLIWLYADQHCRVLSPTKLETANFSQWLSFNSPASLRDFEQQEGWPRWARTFALKLTTTRLNSAITAETLRRGVEITAKLKASAGREANEAWLPHPEVAGAAVEAPSCIWAAADPVPAFFDAGWLPQDSPVLARTDAEIVRRIIRGAAQGDSAILAPAVVLMVDVEALGGEVLDELRRAVEELLGKNSNDRSEPGHRVLLEVTARVYGIQQDVAAFLSAIRSIAVTNARMWPHNQVGIQQEGEPEKAFNALINAAYVFATRSRKPFAEKMQCLAEIIGRIVEAWPKTSTAAISCLDSAVRRMDVATAAGSIWPILMKLRSSSQAIARGPYDAAQPAARLA